MYFKNTDLQYEIIIIMISKLFETNNPVKTLTFTLQHQHLHMGSYRVVTSNIHE